MSNLSFSGRSPARWPDPAAVRRPLIIAHRGARRLAPENTLAAARLAREMGADAWELDVNLTADGRLALVHDDTLARTTDVAARPTQFRQVRFHKQGVQRMVPGRVQVRAQRGRTARRAGLHQRAEQGRRLQRA